MYVANNIIPTTSTNSINIIFCEITIKLRVRFHKLLSAHSCSYHSPEDMNYDVTNISVDV